MDRQKHCITDPATGIEIHFETEGPPDWGNAEPNPNMTTEEPEVIQTEPQVKTFIVEFQLRIDQSVEYLQNVVAYAFDPTVKMLAAIRKDEEAPNGLILTLANLDNIVFVDAPYAPQSIADVMSMIQTPKGTYWEPSQK